MRGFEHSAEAYERGRPGYPPAAVRHLARALHLGPGRTIVELGSGTGKFTRALAPLGAALLAVEPTAGMREVFRRELARVAVVPGTAEAIPVPDSFADAVVAAQAFHWFRPRATLREMARVLRPGGGVALVWNMRDETVPWSRGFSRIVDRYRAGAPRSSDRDWRAAFEERPRPFFPLRRRTFRHVQRLTVQALLDRALSISTVAVQSAAEKRRVVRDLRALLRSDPATRGRRLLRLPYTTEVYWTRLRPGARASQTRTKRHPRHFATLGSARPSYGRSSSRRIPNSSAREGASQSTRTSRSE